MPAGQAIGTAPIPEAGHTEPAGHGKQPPGLEIAAPAAEKRPAAHEPEQSAVIAPTEAERVDAGQVDAARAPMRYWNCAARPPTSALAGAAVCPLEFEPKQTSFCDAALIAQV